MMVLFIVLGVFLDQLTKGLAQAFLSPDYPVSILGTVLQCQLVHNAGAAYGILQGQQALLIGFGVLALVGLWIFRRVFMTSFWMRWGYICVWIGTLGNLVDRVLHGYVIDFVVIHIVPVFNLADVCIDAAIVCFVIDMWVTARSRDNS